MKKELKEIIDELSEDSMIVWRTYKKLQTVACDMLNDKYDNIADLIYQCSEMLETCSNILIEKGH